MQRSFIKFESKYKIPPGYLKQTKKIPPGYLKQTCKKLYKVKNYLQIIMKKSSLFSKIHLPYWVDTLWCLKQTTKVAVFTATFFIRTLPH